MKLLSRVPLAVVSGMGLLSMFAMHASADLAPFPGEEATYRPPAIFTAPASLTEPAKAVIAAPKKAATLTAKTIKPAKAATAAKKVAKIAKNTAPRAKNAVPQPKTK